MAYSNKLSMTPSDYLRVFTSVKSQFNVQYEMKRVHNVKQLSRKRHRMMEEHMEKIGVKLPQNSKFNVNKLVQSLKDYKYHIMPHNKIIQQFNTDFKRGLTQLQVQQRLASVGENVLEQKHKTHWVLVLLQQMSDPFSLFIWFIIILGFIGYPLLNDGNQLLLSILLIVTITSGAFISFGFAQSSTSDIEAFKDFFPKFSNVIRGGQLRLIKSKKLVPGDIVVFSPGDHVPADIRLFESTGMRINKSTFTGQSEPVQIILQDSQNPNPQAQPNPLESPNMVFSGDINVDGQGKGVVVRTGQRMLIANIREVLEQMQPKQSYLANQIGKFVKFITIFCFCIGLYTFFGGWLIGFPVVIAADIAIGVTCASCPGVLNLQLTCILYISVKKLAKLGMVCKNLTSIESLGSTQVLCTDKTGTLTTNRMTVQKMLINNRIVKGTNYEDYHEGYKHQYDVNDPTFQALHKCSILSSIADFNKSLPRQSMAKISSRRDLIEKEKQEMLKQLQKSWQNSFRQLKCAERQVTGDSVESALIRFFNPIQQIKQTKFKYQITRNKKQGRDNRVLFNSTDKYSMSINYDQGQSGDCTAYVKGAPQIIWRMCSHIMINGEKVPINQGYERYFESVAQSWGMEGRRILGLCQTNLPQVKSSETDKITSPQKFIQQRKLRLKNMTFLGAIAMQDPPRKGIADTVLKIKKAGIKIIVITGDQQSTAVSIARQCNIFTDEKTTSQIMLNQGVTFKQAFIQSNNIVMSGEQLLKLMADDEIKPSQERGKEFHKIIQKPNILFTRVSPAQKLYIVQSLQKIGFVVTVTGDGVNDSPAIKMANTGVAMGSGSDAARDASDIVIGNDDLNNIIIGIQQGRKLLDNFKKAICYVMTSQVSEWMPFVFLIITRIPIPIFTLLVDGAADFVPTLAFAYQQSQQGIMTRPPRYKDETLINFRLMAQCQGWMGFSSFLCCMLSYYIIMVDFGFVPNNLWGKSNEYILLQNQWDTYNPTSRFLGNSNLIDLKTCAQFDARKVRIDWINTSFPYTDLRMSGVNCIDKGNGNLQFVRHFQFGSCKIQQISLYTFKPICYTPEATKYAQSSYMFANVVNQVFNWVICRTRRDSAVLKRFNNKVFVFGLSIQAMMAFSLGYSTPWIWMIGTRDVAFQHFGISAIPFSIVQLTMDQIRKFLIRNLPPDKNGRPNWFARNTLW